MNEIRKSYAEVLYYFEQRDYDKTEEEIIKTLRPILSAPNLDQLSSSHIKQLTSIANRLAGHNRGLRVNVLLDKSNLTDKYSQISRLRKSGIDVSIDRVPGIAHNKIIIIDKKIVITGSFNFTNAADKRNAENVIIINNASIAKQYLQNWLSRKEANE